MLKMHDSAFELQQQITRQASRKKARNIFEKLHHNEAYK